MQHTEDISKASPENLHIPLTVVGLTASQCSDNVKIYNMQIIPLIIHRQWSVNIRVMFPYNMTHNIKWHNVQ